jgi:hypothetical protein
MENKKNLYAGGLVTLTISLIMFFVDKCYNKIESNSLPNSSFEVNQSSTIDSIKNIISKDSTIYFASGIEDSISYEKLSSGKSVIDSILLLKKDDSYLRVALSFRKNGLDGIIIYDIFKESIELKYKAEFKRVEETNNTKLFLSTIDQRGVLFFITTYYENFKNLGTINSFNKVVALDFQDDLMIKPIFSIDKRILDLKVFSKSAYLIGESGIQEFRFNGDSLELKQMKLDAQFLTSDVAVLLIENKERDKVKLSLISEGDTSEIKSTNVLLPSEIEKLVLVNMTHFFITGSDSCLNALPEKTMGLFDTYGLNCNNFGLTIDQYETLRGVEQTNKFPIKISFTLKN